MAVKIDTSRSFNKFLQATLGNFLVHRFNVHPENLEILREIPAPYLVMGNHATNWDPFILATFVPHPVNYIASDLLMRNPILRFFLSLVGAIPKSKALADFETVRNIFRVKQQKGVIGVFPEGRRNWDGHSLEPLFPSAKLIKALKIPVILPRISGGFLSLPRWSNWTRKGRMTIEFRIGFTPDEIKRLSAEEIHEKLRELISHDEWEHQKNAMISFRCRRRAEHLELSLFLCPECHSIGTLRGKRAEFSCTSCGHGIHYSEYGFFEALKSKPHFSNIREWNLWQIEYMSSYLLEARSKGSKESLISDRPAWLLTGFRRNPLKKLHYGELHLYADRLEFASFEGEKIPFALEEVTGVTIQVGEKMEFYFGNDLYGVRFPRQIVSAFKWMVAINILKGTDVFGGDGEVP